MSVSRGVSHLHRVVDTHHSAETGAAKCKPGCVKKSEQLKDTEAMLVFIGVEAAST